MACFFGPRGRTSYMQSGADKRGVLINVFRPRIRTVAAQDVD
jgi:hypothetical protein